MQSKDSEEINIVSGKTLDVMKGGGHQQLTVQEFKGQNTGQPGFEPP